MNVDVQIKILGSKEEVWGVITDIENSHKTITGINKIEILEKPKDALVGLKWRETRTLFGKTATEVMWITDVVENESYQTRAESHGAVYTTKLSLSEQEKITSFSMSFNSEAQTFGAKLMSATMGTLFKNATKKALMQDLTDIKMAVENSSPEQ